MKKIEFLATSLPYGLMLETKEKYGEKELVDLYGYEFNEGLVHTSDREEDWWSYDCLNPIIRHPDTLTQECVQADYNNREPFIPIVELARIAFPQYCIKFEDGRVLVDTDWDIASFNFNGKDFASDFFRVFNQLQLFQHLLKFHFWPNKPENEDVVYVTETFNPYAP